MQSFFSQAIKFGSRWDADVFLCFRIKECFTPGKQWTGHDRFERWDPPHVAVISFCLNQQTLPSHTHKVDLIPCRGWIKNSGISHTAGPASYTRWVCVLVCECISCASACPRQYVQSLYAPLCRLMAQRCCSEPAALWPVAYRLLLGTTSTLLIEPALYLCVASETTTSILADGKYHLKKETKSTS